MQDIIRQSGTITKWNDEKGYGFISPHDGSKEIFFHISSIRNSSSRNLENQLVTYLVEPGKDGKFAAGSITLLTAPHKREQKTYRRKSAGLPAWIFSLTFLITTVGMAYHKHINWAIPIVYTTMSLLTYITYCNDKTKALNGFWRTSEKTLHFLEMIGGWPGALIAQWTIFHKNRKESYQVIFWIIIFIHFGILGSIVRDNYLNRSESQYATNNVEIEFLY